MLVPEGVRGEHLDGIVGESEVSELGRELERLWWHVRQVGFDDVNVLQLRVSAEEVDGEVIQVLPLPDADGLQQTEARERFRSDGDARPVDGQTLGEAAQARGHRGQSRGVAKHLTGRHLAARARLRPRTIPRQQRRIQQEKVHGNTNPVHRIKKSRIDYQT